MSQENVKVVRDGWEAWNRGDLDANLRFYAPQVEFDTTRYPEWPDIEGVVRGRDALRRFFSGFLASWETHEARLDTVLDAGDDRVLAIIWQRLRGRASGAEVVMHWAQIYTVRDGMIVRLENYSDRQEALEVVGLRE